MLIGKDLILKLHEEAIKCERKRINYDLRDPDDDISLRLLTVMEPGTQVPIHRHRNTEELFVIVSGKIEERFYDNNGLLTESFILSPLSNLFSMVVPRGQWHNLVVLEECSAIIESRRGPYEPTRKEDVMVL